MGQLITVNNGKGYITFIVKDNISWANMMRYCAQVLGWHICPIFITYIERQEELDELEEYYEGLNWHNRIIDEEKIDEL